MISEIREAIEAACDPLPGGQLLRVVEPTRKYSFETIRKLVLNVLQNISDDMTVYELRDELEIMNNQGHDND